MGPGQAPPTFPTGRRVRKRRWVVERTCAWLGRNRRLSKDDEALPASEKAWISAAACRRLLLPPPAAAACRRRLRRLAR